MVRTTGEGVRMVRRGSGKSVESEFEDAQFTGMLRLQKRNLRRFPAFKKTLDLSDTFVIGECAVVCLNICSDYQICNPFLLRT